MGINVTIIDNDLVDRFNEIAMNPSIPDEIKESAIHELERPHKDLKQLEQKKSPNEEWRELSRKRFSLRVMKQKNEEIEKKVKAKMEDFLPTYKGQEQCPISREDFQPGDGEKNIKLICGCLLYTSPSPRD